MSVENVENHMANTCKCGSVNFALLKSGAIECNKCSDVMSEAKWLSAQPVEEHSLSLSYQIRRAIKAEDALRTAKQEVANLNELLNASYVDPTGKSGLSALLKKVFWPSKLDKEILELVASQAIELEELGKEVTCIPDMREEIVYLKAQIAAQQAQPEPRPTEDALWDETLKDRDAYHQFADDLAAQIAAITGVDIGEHSSMNNPWQEAMLAADDFIATQLKTMLLQQAQPVQVNARLPERAPSDADCDRAYRNGLKAGFSFGLEGNEEGFRKSLESYQREIAAHGIKQGGQHD